MTNNVSAASAYTNARRQLGLSENVTPQAIRRAFMTKLRDEEFLPDSVMANAFFLLEGSRTEPDLEWLVSEDGRLRDEIALFARDIFKLEIDARKQRWSELQSQCVGFPAHESRLQELRVALEIRLDEPTDSTSMESRLIEQLVNSITTSGFARADARQRFLKNIFAHPAQLNQWREAARSLAAQRSELAKLDPRFLEEVTNRQHQTAPRKRPTASTPASKEKSGIGFSWTILLPGVAIALFRLMVGLAGSSTPGHTQPTSFPWLTTPTNLVRPDQTDLKGLLDHRKYRIELVGVSPSRRVRFVPHVISASTPRVVEFSELRLRLMGVDSLTIDELFARGSPATSRAIPRKNVRSPASSTSR